MSKVKNISGGPLDVPLLDRQVEAGETVDVPDSLHGGHIWDADGNQSDAPRIEVVWPPNRWEPVPDPVVTPESGKKKAAS